MSKIIWANKRVDFRESPLNNAIRDGSNSDRTLFCVWCHQIGAYSLMACSQVRVIEVLNTFIHFQRMDFNFLS